MYNYQLDQDGYIIGEYVGETKPGWFASVVPIDGTVFRVVANKLVEIPTKVYAQIYQGKVMSLMSCRKIPPLSPQITMVDVTDMENKPRHGWLFANGIFAENVLTLEQKKTNKMLSLKEEFKKECYGVIWSSAVGNVSHGYDADSVSICNFLAAMKAAEVLTQKWSALPENTRGDLPTVPYNVYFLNGKKDLLLHTFAEFEQILVEASIFQGGCYNKLKTCLVELGVAKTDSEVELVQYTVE